MSTEEFDTIKKLLPKDYQEQISKIILQLKESFNVGKPLGNSFFREKKMGKYRIYFLVYEDLNTTLLITISDKKAQQTTINQIKEQLNFYNELIKKKL